MTHLVQCLPYKLLSSFPRAYIKKEKIVRKKEEKKKKREQMGTVISACNPGTGEVEMGRSPGTLAS